LLARRAPTTRNAGQWNFFGGGLNPGERPVRTALRELKEEAGVIASKEDLVELGDAATFSKRNILFGLKVDEEFAPILNGESTHWEWVNVPGLEMRADLHLPTSLLLGSLSAWLAHFPRLTETVLEQDGLDDFWGPRVVPILDLNP
jgi:8-oxo-dGTP pyrophosphatase MutT (NUDIX family)